MKRAFRDRLRRAGIVTAAVFVLVVLAPGPAAASYYTNETYICAVRASYTLSHDPVADVARAHVVIENSGYAFQTEVTLTIMAAETHPDASEHEVFVIDHVYGNSDWWDDSIYFSPTESGYIDVYIYSTGVCWEGYDVHTDRWFYDSFGSTPPPCVGEICAT